MVLVIVTKRLSLHKTIFTQENELQLKFQFLSACVVLEIEHPIGHAKSKATYGFTKKSDVKQAIPLRWIYRPVKNVNLGK